MLIVIFLIVTLLILIYIGYDKQENFTLFTANPVHLISSKIIDDMPRHIRLSHGGGIIYISNYPPMEPKSKCNNIKCPYFIDELTTLGKNNFCWKC